VISICRPPDRKVRRTGSCSRPSHHSFASDSSPLITGSRVSHLFNDHGRRPEGDRSLTERTSKATAVSATPTGAHIWADRFDGAIKNIFDLQNQVTASVVGAIALKMERAQIERARHKPTEKWMLSITICKACRGLIRQRGKPTMMHSLSGHARPAPSGSVRSQDSLPVICSPAAAASTITAKDNLST
jgi:hypothetical protein